jgi:hypothetical protein
MFVLLALLAVAMMLYLARALSFMGDEWVYIVDRRLTFESMLQPHNEHLAFFHVLVYRGMVESFRTGWYLPFQVALLAIHVAAAAGVLALLSRYVALEAALAAAVLFLFLGTGYDNLLAAFQIGFAGAVALGIWAIVVVDRPWLSALLLTAALWTQCRGCSVSAQSRWSRDSSRSAEDSRVPDPPSTSLRTSSVWTVTVPSRLPSQATIGIATSGNSVIE